MLSFQIVAYAIRSPRDWYTSVGGGREFADRTAAELMGGSPVFRGMRPAPALANHGLVGIWSQSDAPTLVLVVWSGVPDSAFAWDRLHRDPRCQRFSVAVNPAADYMEARWTDASGQVLRHVVISGGKLVINSGDAHLVDEDAQTDTTLRIDYDLRLPAATVKRLLTEATPDQVKTYDHRRYVRTDDADLLGRGRLVHTDQLGGKWVAVEQSGTLNTLFDPLADLSGPRP